MRITWLIYKQILPELLWEKFRSMANNSRAQFTAIIYENKDLRWANADEK